MHLHIGILVLRAFHCMMQCNNGLTRNSYYIGMRLEVHKWPPPHYPHICTFSRKNVIDKSFLIALVFWGPFLGRLNNVSTVCYPPINIVLFFTDPCFLLGVRHLCIIMKAPERPHSGLFMSNPTNSAEKCQDATGPKEPRSYCGWGEVWP